MAAIRNPKRTTEHSGEFSSAESDGLRQLMTIERGRDLLREPRPSRAKQRVTALLLLSIDAIIGPPRRHVVVGTKGANVTRDYPTNVRVAPAESGLSMETAFLCFQIRSLDAKRFPQHAAGRITGAKLKKVEDTVRYCLGL